MKNSPFGMDSESTHSLSGSFGADHLPMSFHEKLLNIYWLKKDIESILDITDGHVNDSLTDASQLLNIIEAQIVRILHSSSKNDAAFQDYWGFN